jgi:hypothetical protein
VDRDGEDEGSNGLKGVGGGLRVEGVGEMRETLSPMA